MIRTLILIIVTLLLLPACREKQITPKPRAYPRVEYPTYSYKEYGVEGCPYTFQYPSYGEIKDKDQPCWFDIYMPVFKARLHCSYLAIDNREDYDDFVKDAYVIADKINERGNYMEETRIQNPQGVGGVSLRFTGPAASPMHFFLTDATHHFFKAALYFDSKVQPDSLAPIEAFIQKDIDQMISTFQWKE